MGPCHVSGGPETVGPSLPDSLWVSQSGSLKGGAVSANRSHSLFSTEEGGGGGARRGRGGRGGGGGGGGREEGEAVAPSYLNYRTHFEGLVSKHWTDKKHSLMKGKIFLSKALCSPTSAGT